MPPIYTHRVHTKELLRYDVKNASFFKTINQKKKKKIDDNLNVLKITGIYILPTGY
jgi:hypothetical protein